MDDTNIAIVGAGPHGLSAAAHLRRAHAECRVFGDPMSFWRSMPEGMLLRSNWTATCIAEYRGPLSLDSYCVATGRRPAMPIELEHFIEYGMWVQQQVAPAVDQGMVERIEPDGERFRLSLSDGRSISARRVIVAAGIAAFVHRPDISRGFPRELVSHTADHRDLGRFKGQQVLVVGGGQSALESAALLREAGADVEVVVRADDVNWLHGGKYHRMLGPRFKPLLYAPTDVGPMGISRIVAVPNLFRRLPRAIQDPMAYRAIRPAGALWLKPRLVDVGLSYNLSLRALCREGTRMHAELSDGSARDVDHVLFGTGYRVDVARYPFLDEALLAHIEAFRGYPVLRPGMESSVPRLHFIGAPAAWSFGPIMRFVAGGWFGGQSVARVAMGKRSADLRPSSNGHGSRTPASAAPEETRAGAGS
jgi:hypothetical protein